MVVAKGYVHAIANGVSVDSNRRDPGGGFRLGIFRQAGGKAVYAPGGVPATKQPEQSSLRGLCETRDSP